MFDLSAELGELIGMAMARSGPPEQAESDLSAASVASERTKASDCISFDHSPLMVQLEESSGFVERARARILDHAETRREAGLTDKIYAVVQSEAGSLYDGIPFETSMAQFDFCAERHAINNMHYAEPESGKVDSILVATPVPHESVEPPTPCGACRHAINQFSDDGTVYCSTFVRKGNGWSMFPAIDEYSASELYPGHQGQPSWE